MEAPHYTFRLNRTINRDITMSDAIEFARTRVLTTHQPVVLQVESAPGRWLHLGTYANVDKRDWEYLDEKEHVFVPVVDVDAAVPDNYCYDNPEPSVIFCYRSKGGIWRLFFDGQTDPHNRTFESIVDAKEWFKGMKAAGLFHNVPQLTF